MIKFEEIIEGLAAAEIRFVLVGGLAASAHGSAYVTQDVDICYERTPENVRKIVAYLKAIHAKLRSAPGDLPFLLDERTFSFGINFTFQTDLGDLDLLGDMAGVGSYAEARKLSESIDLFGHRVKVLSIEGLIKAKKAAGRPKDIAHIKELEVIRAKKQEIRSKS
jgi:predicted nucleotidyltransferase